MSRIRKSKSDRKTKVKRRETRLVRAKKKKLDLFHSALDHAGLRDAYQKLHDLLRAKLLTYVLPEPVVELGAGTEGLPEATSLRNRFYELWRAPSSEKDETLSPREWFCVLNGLQDRLTAMEYVLRTQRKTDFAKPYWQEMAAFAAQVREVVGTRRQSALGWFILDLWQEILLKSRIEHRIFWYDLSWLSTSRRKSTYHVVLRCLKPKPAVIEVDRSRRPVFRCTLFASPPEAKELSWPRSELGVTFGPDEFPVYMQSHVLEQLKRRIPFSSPVSVTLSLGKPVFVKRDDDSILVEYRCGDHRLGYFVGAVIGDKVLIKTFLFLTMQGTPEADLLYKKLRLTRKDIEYTRLDELSLFAAPDIRQDKELTRMLQQCACGHLLELDLEEELENVRTGGAAFLRDFLAPLHVEAEKSATPTA